MNQPERDLLWALKGEADYYKLPIRTIIEAGACDGTDTGDILASFPEAQVFAFEPNPEAADICRETYAGKDRISFEQRALGDVAGPLTFRPTIHGPGHWSLGSSSRFEAVIRSDGKPSYPQATTEVQCERLDAWATANGVEAIDLLWFDMEGSEVSALRGLGSMIESVSLIASEFFLSADFKSQPLFGDLWRFLDSAGFVMVYWALAKVDHDGNCIWVNRRKLCTSGE